MELSSTIDATAGDTASGSTATATTSVNQNNSTTSANTPHPNGPASWVAKRSNLGPHPTTPLLSTTYNVFGNQVGNGPASWLPGTASTPFATIPPSLPFNVILVKPRYVPKSFVPHSL